MPRPIDKLGLHSHIMPTYHLLAARDEGVRYEVGERPQFFSALWPDQVLLELEAAVVFDCRSIPWQFLRDTAQAAFEEAEQTRQIVRLPFPQCYFEFDTELAVLAVERGCEYEFDDETACTVECCAFHGWGRGDLEWYADQQHDCYGEFSNGFDLYDDIPQGVGEPKFFQAVNSIDKFGKPVNEKAEMSANLAGCFLVGILALLNEKLVAQEIRPDPAPKLNRARARRGLGPVSSATRILTINVAAVRQLASRTAISSHESPALHWRRGHWRHLHRFSEFESRTWVKRCLVGDPSKGYIGHRDFKLVWQQPMIQPSQQA